MSDQKKTFLNGKTLLRIGGSAVFLALFLLILPTDAILGALTRISLAQFLLVLLGFLALHVLAALKWWTLLDRRISPFLAVRAHFAGLASNLFLPGSIGGDAVRGALAYRATGDGAGAVASGATDRMVDFVALLILSMCGLLLSLGDGGDMRLSAQVVAIFAAVIVGAVVAIRQLPRLWDLFPSLPGKGFALKLSEAFARLARRRLQMLVVLIGSVAIQFGLVWLSYRLAITAGADVGLGHWLFAWPLAKLISVLPISFNGLGFREAALAGILAPVGGDAAAIVAAGLFWQGVMFAAGGIGALAFLGTGGRGAVTEPPAQNG